VAAGVRVLRAESRPEGVDLGERQAVRLDIKLPRNRQERLAAEEILRKVDLVLSPFGGVTSTKVEEISAAIRECEPTEATG
jgi:hypothetical protein